MKGWAKSYRISIKIYIKKIHLTGRKDKNTPIEKLPLYFFSVAYVTSESTAVNLSLTRVCLADFNK
jgi:hypothetical protein